MNDFIQGLMRYIGEEDLRIIKGQKIGIAGAGGLGSNCAVNLVRLGFSDFVIVDFDVVEPSNLNRQFYFYRQIGLPKVEALKSNLLAINPDLRIETHQIRLDGSNISEVFFRCPLVVEAFDTIEGKKMLIENLAGSKELVVSASGLGEGGSTDRIRTGRISPSLIVVGDGVSDTEKGVAPLSPGVSIAAAKEAGALFNHVLKRDRGRSFSLPDLYGLTYSEASAGRSNVEVVREMIRGGIKLIQYREKDKSMAEKYAECWEIRRLTAEAGVCFIVNDHPELALLVGADGIHVGQDDVPVRDLRNLVGEDMIIGLSTHSPAQALEAVRKGADYIGVGPIFATKTKKNVCAPVGFEYLEWVTANLDIPFVAIGGIKKHNLREIVSRGAKSVALVSEITSNGEIPALISELRHIIKENSK